MLTRTNLPQNGSPVGRELGLQCDALSCGRESTVVRSHPLCVVGHSVRVLAASIVSDFSAIHPDAMTVMTTSLLRVGDRRDALSCGIEKIGLCPRESFGKSYCTQSVTLMRINDCHTAPMSATRGP
jgi:hypothetical protein